MEALLIIIYFQKNRKKHTCKRMKIYTNGNPQKAPRIGVSGLFLALIINSILVKTTLYVKCSKEILYVCFLKLKAIKETYFKCNCVLSSII